MTPENTAEKLGVSTEVARTALANLESGSSHWIVVSGKICSGKDTIAPLVQPALGYPEALRIGYGDSLRADVAAATAIIKRGGRRADAVKEIAAVLDRTDGASAEIFDTLEPFLDLDSHQRTHLGREILIKMGSVWLRDNEQLSRKVAALCLEKLAVGDSIYLTGGRFEPDVRIPQDAGAMIIRLDVSPEVQRMRLMARDGLEPLPEVINDPGEVALDDWPHFDVRVLNDGTLDAGLAAVLAQIEEKR